MGLSSCRLTDENGNGALGLGETLTLGHGGETGDETGAGGEPAAVAEREGEGHKMGNVRRRGD